MMKQSKATISLPKNYSKTLQQMVVGVNFKNTMEVSNEGRRIEKEFSKR